MLIGGAPFLISARALRTSFDALLFSAWCALLPYLLFLTAQFRTPDIPPADRDSLSTHSVLCNLVRPRYGIIGPDTCPVPARRGGT